MPKTKITAKNYECKYGCKLIFFTTKQRGNHYRYCRAMRQDTEPADQQVEDYNNSYENTCKYIL